MSVAGTGTNVTAVNGEFVRAAYYFGSGWPLNCWTVMNIKQARRDFAQLRHDGFNTVILLVPWRGFQQRLGEPALRQDYLDLLRRLCRTAARGGLQVILRLSYAHHFCDEANASSEDFTTAVLSYEAGHEEWLAYLRALHAALATEPSVIAAFIAWEEFWSVFSRFTTEKPVAREQFAQRVGYGEWLQGQGEQLPSSPVQVPQPEDPAAEHYWRFVNLRLRELYTAAVAAYPGLGFEFRVDRNRVQRASGEVDWVANDDYRDIAQQRYSYWAPFIGARNCGETLDANAAAELLKHSLEAGRPFGTGAAPLMDQFNFIDATFKYTDEHARIAAPQLREFLRLAAPMLLQHCSGYGIWCWRDYHQNTLINPQFQQGLSHWKTLAGNPRVRRWPRRSLALRAGDAVGQSFLAVQRGLHGRYRSPVLQLQLVLASTASPGAMLEASLDGEHWVAVPLAGVTGAGELPTGKWLWGPRGANFALRCVAGNVELQSLSLHQNSYCTGFRGTDGSPGEHWHELLYLNAAIRQLQG